MFSLPNDNSNVLVMPGNTDLGLSSMLFRESAHHAHLQKGLDKAPITSKDAHQKLANAKALSIDDMDMIGLKTAFDSQMLLGSPMYFDSDSEENVHPITDQDTEPRVNDEDNVPQTESGAVFQTSENVFKNLLTLRRKYMEGSFQDAASDRKNDLDTWLVYPKPLPKFWKFEKDNRFKDLGMSASDLDLTHHDLKKANNHGYYYPHNIDEEFLLGRKKQNPHFTGEYFKIDLYKKAYKKHVIKHSLLRCDNELRYLPTFQDFRTDFKTVVAAVQSARLNQISERRLLYLLDKFELFQFLKQKSEILENKQVPYRDFYNSRKVDRDLLLSGCVGKRQLSEYIWEKLNNEPERVVYIDEDGKEIQLQDFFQCGENQNEESCIPVGLKLIDDDFLEWYKDIYLVSYHLFRASVVPIKQSLKGKHYRYYLLTRTFLEFDNHIDGEYFAEIFTRFSLHTLEKSKYQLAQVSIDYQFTDESGSTSGNWWLKFSDWLMRHNLISYNVRWNVRIARCYSPLFALNKVGNFQDFLDLIFRPLREAMYCDDIRFHFIMTNVCSLDLVISQVDDYMWKAFEDTNLEPKNWSAGGDNPTISQYMYYIYRNLAELNSVRYNCYQNTIVLRNNCCPSVTTNRTSQFGDTQLIFNEQVESLVCNLLLCSGGLLQSEPIWSAPATLEYLYYLFQIPITASPLSSVSSGTTMMEDYRLSTSTSIREGASEKNFVTDRREANKLRNLSSVSRRTYSGNPFMKLFKIGFQVSLSSASILFNSSYTQEPMMEEYSVAASIYLLNAADLCELSRNSVLASGYDGWYKSHWIGAVVKRPRDKQVISQPLGMVDVWYDKEPDTRERHNVPFLRRYFRNETLNQEWTFVHEEM